MAIPNQCPITVRIESDDDPLCATYLRCEMAEGHTGEHQATVNVEEQKFGADDYAKPTVGTFKWFGNRERV